MAAHSTLPSSFLCFHCSRTLRVRPRTATTYRTLFSASAQPSRKPIPTDYVADVPRWKRPLPAMRMPQRLRPLPAQPRWKVNESQPLLDAMFDRFVGACGEAAREQEGLQNGAWRQGSALLDTEVKWLAVTHKSHEHGALGFNDRLAYLGKRLLDLETSLALLQPATTATSMAAGDDVLARLTPGAKHTILAPRRLADVARSYGVDRVVRWKPRKTDRLAMSGQDTVLAHTLCAIIGALAMQRGGRVATECLRKRVLEPLGVR